MVAGERNSDVQELSEVLLYHWRGRALHTWHTKVFHAAAVFMFEYIANSVQQSVAAHG